MAMPPLRKRQASRKFYVPVGVSGRDHMSRAVALTKRVMANVYKTKMNRNLKKCAASCASPTIQYVLTVNPSALLLKITTTRTHIEDTIIVGMTRSGMTSKTKRDNSQAVGLQSRLSS